MGMYTEFHYNAELPPDTPKEVLDVLRFMLGETKAEPPLPDHPLFKTEQWDCMLRMDSYYFAADTHSTLRFDEHGNCYYLCIRCNLKNYDDEIEKFCDWIKPYVSVGWNEFLGFYRDESSDRPTLIYYDYIPPKLLNPDSPLFIAGMPLVANPACPDGELWFLNHERWGLEKKK